MALSKMILSQSTRKTIKHSTLQRQEEADKDESVRVEITTSERHSLC